MYNVCIYLFVNSVVLFLPAVLESRWHALLFLC